MLDRINRPGFNRYATLLGIQFTEIGEANTVCTLEISEQHHHPGGVVHGGVAYSMADSAMAVGLISTLGRGQECATIESKISYLSAVREGTLRCRASILKKGKRVAFTEAEVFAGDQLVAKATGTFAILDPN